MGLLPREAGHWHSSNGRRGHGLSGHDVLDDASSFIPSSPRSNHRRTFANATSARFALMLSRAETGVGLGMGSLPAIMSWYRAGSTSPAGLSHQLSYLVMYE
ncbi:hypothetical protein GQ602_001667 [Ophiocordyceps camponoti-floridani]|uniref:Uncharacterized protein n=1 Tax=Ophiocordyceps camponoti-floridani TaxID=2030778 RepID=A0A8H4Q900_9HYPO|nr:hypothetical protein GQ602_001667 [Ophiocordyceps camponoti-floridani]